MTRETAEHFYNWLFAHVAEDEQHSVEQAIHSLLRNHPDLADHMSWPEMRNLAERNLS
jgi:hypothetical protein